MLHHEGVGVDWPPVELCVYTTGLDVDATIMTAPPLVVVVVDGESPGGMYTEIVGIGWTVTSPPPQVGGRLTKEVWAVAPTVSVMVIGAMLAGKDMTVEGGTTLCTGVMTPLTGSLELIVTGQKDTVLTTKGGILMVVVKVTVAPPLEEYTAVPYGGHDTVRGVGSFNGGQCRVQGG